MTLLTQLVLHFNGPDGLERAGVNPSSLPSNSAPMDILVNSLWFLSLISSIITASVGIFLKQWLRNYLNINCSSSEEWVRIRQVRNESAHKWKMFQLSDLLPLFLHIALLSFLIGLALFLLSINLLVGWIITANVILYLSGLVLVFVVPMVSASCPYQLAILRRATEYVRGSFIRIVYGTRWRQRLNYDNPLYRFPGYERGIRREQRLDVEAVISADTFLMDDFALEETLKPCLAAFELGNTLLFIRKVFANRLDRHVSHLKEVEAHDYILIPRRVRVTLLNIYVECVKALFTKDDEARMIRGMGQYRNIIELFWGLETLTDYLSQARWQAIPTSAQEMANTNIKRLEQICLLPSLEAHLSGDDRLQILSFGSKEFIRITIRNSHLRSQDKSSFKLLEEGKLHVCFWILLSKTLSNNDAVFRG